MSFHSQRIRSYAYEYYTRGISVDNGIIVLGSIGCFTRLVCSNTLFSDCIFFRV
jgi:hypothetical protein